MITSNTVLAVFTVILMGIAVAVIVSQLVSFLLSFAPSAALYAPTKAHETFVKSQVPRGEPSFQSLGPGSFEGSGWFQQGFMFSFGGFRVWSFGASGHWWCCLGSTQTGLSIYYQGGLVAVGAFGYSRFWGWRRKLSSDTWQPSWPNHRPCKPEVPNLKALIEKCSENL